MATELTQKKSSSYAHADLTEKIIGCAYSIFHDLGYGYPEKIYQNSFVFELQKQNLDFEREKFSKITYKEQVVGKYFLDFLVDNKVAIELKVRKEMYESDWLQLLSYLKSENIKVGLLIVFSPKGVLIKRLVN
ncbi:MAG: GxxExxY protein [Candidatus Berkelbacteria bacterium]|nr:GxxExxY protein [Candidatus Berkelbacteria bacterium]